MPIPDIEDQKYQDKDFKRDYSLFNILCNLKE